MKQKINVMKHTPEPSDEEIRGYMNFEKLLTNAKVAASPNSSYQGIRYFIPIVIMAGFAVWLYYDVQSTKSVETTSNAEGGVPGSLTLNEPLAAAEKDEIEGEVPQINNSAVPSRANPDKLKPPALAPAEISITENIYIQAEPVDGYTGLYEYFSTNLVYPEESLDEKVEGVQTISFTINEQGKPVSLRVKESLGEPFEMEAKRLIENMPRWKPATLNGTPVASEMSLPLTFQIKKVILKE